MFNNISIEECRDIFGRTLRFTKNLHIYDKQIGRCVNEKSAASFRRGIEFILDVWKEKGHFQEKNVEIWTFIDHRHDKKRRTESSENLKTKIVGRLREKFPISDSWKIQYHLGEDTEQRWHARYLETDGAILLLERGFDFIDYETKTLKPTYLILIDKAQKELEDFREHSTSADP